MTSSKIIIHLSVYVVILGFLILSRNVVQKIRQRNLEISRETVTIMFSYHGPEESDNSEDDEDSSEQVRKTQSSTRSNSLNMGLLVATS